VQRKISISATSGALTSLDGDSRPSPISRPMHKPRKIVPAVNPSVTSMPVTNRRS
jgi:hypothetical protein